MGKNENIKVKKDNTYTWLAFICLLFFWAPFVNIVLFMFSIYFSLKQLRLVKFDSSKYGSYWFSIILFIISILCLIITVLIFYLIFYYDIKLY